MDEYKDNLIGGLVAFIICLIGTIICFFVFYFGVSPEGNTADPWWPIPAIFGVFTAIPLIYLLWVWRRLRINKCCPIDKFCI